MLCPRRVTFASVYKSGHIVTIFFCSGRRKLGMRYTCPPSCLSSKGMKEALSRGQMTSRRLVPTTIIMTFLQFYRFFERFGTCIRIDPLEMVLAIVETCRTITFYINPSVCNVKESGTDGHDRYSPFWVWQACDAFWGWNQPCLVWIVQLVVL